MIRAQSIAGDGGATGPQPGILTPALSLARSMTFRLQELLQGAFEPDDAMDAFVYRGVQRKPEPRVDLSVVGL